MRLDSNIMALVDKAPPPFCTLENSKHLHQHNHCASLRDIHSAYARLAIFMCLELYDRVFFQLEKMQVCRQ
jgi:hypothetical protein